MGGGEEDSNGGDDGEGGEGYQTKPVTKISYMYFIGNHSVNIEDNNRGNLRGQPKKTTLG